MSDITYEQFMAQCKHWEYATADEGYKAMCFVSHLIAQHLTNATDAAKKIAADESAHGLMKRLSETKEHRALTLTELYGRFESSVFEMLTKQEANNG